MAIPVQWRYPHRDHTTHTHTNTHIITIPSLLTNYHYPIPFFPDYHYQRSPLNHPPTALFKAHQPQPDSHPSKTTRQSPRLPRAPFPCRFSAPYINNNKNIRAYAPYRADGKCPSEANRKKAMSKTGGRANERMATSSRQKMGLIGSRECVLSLSVHVLS